MTTTKTAANVRPNDTIAWGDSPHTHTISGVYARGPWVLLTTTEGHQYTLDTRARVRVVDSAA